jgi:recombination associated protein RdgC
MWFKNLQVFRLPANTEADLGQIEDKLAGFKLRSPGPLELSTRGFVSPYGRNQEVLCHQMIGASLLTLGGEDRLLPGAVVREELAERIERLEAERGRRPGAKERLRLKDEVLTDLMPRAFIRPSRQNAYLDTQDSWFVVDASSPKPAEEVANLLREALGSFAVTPVIPEQSPRILMTHWLQSGELPANFELGDECELRDPADAGAIVRCRRQDLTAEEMREHLEVGKQVFQLALTFDGRVSFVLGEDLKIRKLRFLDIVMDQLEAIGQESVVAEVDACFAIMVGELRLLLKQLDAIFGLSDSTPT